MTPFTNHLRVPDELDNLRRWKVEAMAVLAEWDAVAAALDDAGLDFPLGELKPRSVLAAVEKLLAERTERG